MKNEDVPRRLTREDHTGVNNDFLGPAEAMRAGIGKENFGQRSDIEGEDIDPTTKRGNRESTHATRRHIENID